MHNVYISLNIVHQLTARVDPIVILLHVEAGALVVQQILCHIDKFIQHPTKVLFSALITFQLLTLQVHMECIAIEMQRLCLRECGCKSIHNSMLQHAT